MADEKAIVALNEVVPELIELLKQLPPELFKPCEMMFHQGKTIDETAAELNITREEVLEHTYSVASLLRKTLEDRLDLEELSKVWPKYGGLTWFLNRH